MSFTDAIKSGFDNYVNFEGRASRAAYWWWFLFVVLVSVVASIISSAADTMFITYLVYLALFLPGLAVAIRRLHDTDRSGWWILIGLIPIIGFIVLIVFYVQEGTPGPNKYGPPPADVSAPAASAPPAA